MLHNSNTLITNIQRMCMNDGPGIRTTVFLKGCNLHCPWCANPENIRLIPEEYEKNGIRGIYGKSYNLDEVYQNILKDIGFWEKEGGVTFSGGEPLMHMDYLEPLMQRLKESHVHIVMETALFVEKEYVIKAIPYVDMFIVDMKILQPDICKDIIGGDVSIYLNNLEMLIAERKMILLRIPCNYEYTMSETNMKLILAWCKEHPQIPIEIFSTHSLGEAKYISLGRSFKKWQKVSDEDLKKISIRLQQCGNKVTINYL